MKISKLFHWLYAILMLLPFGLLVFNALSSMWSGNTINDSSIYWAFLNEVTFSVGSLSETVYGVFEYLCSTVFGLTEDYLYHITHLLTYWTVMSIIWLVFDVFMYVPLLVHRWIDKAKIE